MKERPIHFNSEMVRAVLEGRKVQTRRIMKVQPDSPNFGLLRITDSTKRADIDKYHWAESNATGTHTRSALFSCPFGAVGDRLWVRETWQGPLFDEEQLDEFLRDTEPFYTPKYCQYAADGGPKPEYTDGDDNTRYGWRPSIHMPRWASRITLEITGVRVERLQDISDADAQAEGCWFGRGGGEPDLAVSPADHFPTLWASIYGEESWQANPWVWVIEFKRVGGDS